MYQPLDSLGGNVISSVAAFEKTIYGSDLKLIRDEVYIVGEYGWFRVGTLFGDNEVVVGFSKIVDKYRRFIEDKIRDTGVFTIMQRQAADWL